MSNEWSRFSSEIQVLGVLNVGHENISKENIESDMVA
jgi:hypothetical protein